MSDRLDRGLAAAFGPHSGSDSVLEQLGLRGPSLILETDGGGRGAAAPLAAETLLGTSSEGRYEVDGEIARGGVGVVLRGRDLELGRDVAVKVLRPELATRQDVLWRFVEEAQIGGQLQHPGIAPVYDLGLLADQRPYFAMKLVRGETLADLLEARRTPTTELGRHLRIFEQVCQTVGYAHARGVVHRDLKPANVMVGAFGEVQVMDWGFAKVLAHGGVADERAPLLDETSIHTVRTDSGGSASQLGSVMGTPSYMPPEQAKGQLDRVDERSDVFGLGAMLLEILTGAPPYPVARDTLIRAARGDLDDALGRLGEAAVDPRLAALCTACLSVDPNARPQDAGEVAERVGQHLADLEASARAEEGEAAAAAVRARGARRARRLTLGIAAAALLSVVLAGGGYVWARNERVADRQRAREVLARALAAIDQRIGEAEAIEAQGLDGWDERGAAYERAREMVREAERLVPAAALGGSRVNPLTERIADIDAGLAAAGAGAARAERDRRLAAHLERIRTGEAGFGRKRSVPLAFAEHGLDVLNGDPETVAAAIRDSWIARDLVTALENWANASGAYDMTPSPAGLHVLDVLALADPDPLRQAIREAARTHDIDRLRSLAADDSPALFEESTPSRLAIHLMRGDDTDAARTLLEEALRRKPDRFWVSIQLAFSLLQHEPKRPTEAEGYLRAALALQPKSVLARRWLGHVLAAQGREAEADEMWLDGVRDDPAHYLAFEPAVVQRLAGDDRMQAVARAVEEEAERSPDDAGVVFRLGGVREIQGQWPAAAAAYARAVAESPEEPRYRMRLAVAALHTGNWERAHEQYVAMRDLAPGEPAFHVLFGDALQQRGELQAALDAYDAAFRLQPGRPGLDLDARSAPVPTRSDRGSDPGLRARGAARAELRARCLLARLRPTTNGRSRRCGRGLRARTAIRPDARSLATASRIRLPRRGARGRRGGEAARVLRPRTLERCLDPGSRCVPQGRRGSRGGRSPVPSHGGHGAARGRPAPPDPPRAPRHRAVLLRACRPRLRGRLQRGPGRGRCVRPHRRAVPQSGASRVRGGPRRGGSGRGCRTSSIPTHAGPGVRRPWRGWRRTARPGRRCWHAESPTWQAWGHRCCSKSSMPRPCGRSIGSARCPSQNETRGRASGHRSASSRHRRT